jgi:chemotaxis protein MotB
VTQPQRALVPFLWGLGMLLGASAGSLGCAPVHRYPDGTGLEGQLEREVVALKLRVQELEANLARAPISSQPNNLVPELVQVFSGSGVLVSPYGRGARLNVPVELVFADVPGRRLRGEGTMVFDLLATAITKHDQYDVLVIGYWSDRAPPKRSAPTALHLTLDLARTFAGRLEELGVPAERMWIGGRGDHGPITTNDLPEGQDANERIEVLLAVPVPTIE